MGFARKEQLPLCMNTSTIRFKPLDESVINIIYFQYFLKSEDFKKQLIRQITGSAQLNFGPSHLKRMSVPLPDIELQTQFAVFVTQVDKLRFDDLSRLFPPHSPPNRKPELRMTGRSGKKTCDELLSQRGQFNNSADSFFSCADLEKSKTYLADTIRSSRSYS